MFKELQPQKAEVAVVMKPKVTVAERRNSFFELLKSQNAKLAIGLIPINLSADKAREAQEAIGEVLESDLRIEPLFFDDIYIWPASYDLESAKYTFNEKSPESFRGHACPSVVHTRYGATRLHDDMWILWRRRTAQDYVRDKNGIPKKAQRVMEKLHALGLPLNASLTIWTPAYDNMADPMLVLEFADNICIGLCRWNPTL